MRAIILTLLTAFAMSFILPMNVEAQMQKTTGAREEAAATPFNPRAMQTMPRIREIPNPGLNFAEVQARCLKIFSSKVYTTTLVVQGDYNPERDFLLRVMQKFSTEGKPSSIVLADGRPTCAVRVETTVVNYPGWNPIIAHFDGMHLVWYGQKDQCSIYSVREGTLTLTRFFTYPWAPSKVRMQWGTLRQPD